MTKISITERKKGKSEAPLELPPAEEAFGRYPINVQVIYLEQLRPGLHIKGLWLRWRDSEGPQSIFLPRDIMRHLVRGAQWVLRGSEEEPHHNGNGKRSRRKAADV